MKKIWKAFAIVLMFCCNFAFGQSASSNFDNNMNISTGNANAVSGAGNTQVINFAGGSAAPSTGMIAIPQHQAPSVFNYIPNSFGMPAEVTGMTLEVFYDQKCQPEENESGESRVIEKNGASSLTKLTITTHPYFDGMKRSDKQVKVRMDLSGEKKRYRCLGIMTAVADKDALEKGQPVGFSVLASDMRRAVRAEFIGVEGDVVLLSGANYWGGAVGVSSHSSGVSLGASLVNIVGRLTNLGIAPGVAGGSGASSPTARSGLTALILVKVADNDADGIEIGLSDMRNPFGEAVQIAPVGGNGRNAEAEKR